jgi:two-component system CheB/CheR fusion protein
MGRAKRVLVVDDNKDMVATTMHLLRTMGHEVRGCYNAVDAISFVGEFLPDVVVMGLAMPGLSGWNAAEMIRDRYPKPPLLIAVTGEYRGGADRILSHAAGFDHYVLKPAHPSVLEKMIAGAPHK